MLGNENGRTQAAAPVSPEIRECLDLLLTSFLRAVARDPELIDRLLAMRQAKPQEES